MEEKQTYKPVIIIPAHRRVKSLQRLLASINEASFSSDDIQLIISVDGDADPDVSTTAKEFQFNWGNVEVREQEKQLGICRHIMRCGDLTRDYGSVVILEDDLIVGPAFYEYAGKTLTFYEGDQSIAGISLYSQRFNETAQLPFEPMENDWPVYFMQLGCSWGQAWTDEQWTGYKKWYAKNGFDASATQPEIPADIKKWPGSSWKKYFNYYLIEEQKYIVYPYKSFSTNSSEGDGVHMKDVNNCFHVPLYMSGELGSGFNLPLFKEQSFRYDAFMESQSSLIEEWTGLPLEEMELDLYGKKPADLLQKKKYAITSKPVKNPARSFPLSFRPVELNLKYESQSEKDSFFHLKKTAELKQHNSAGSIQFFKLADYFSYFPIQSRRFAVIYFKQMLRNSINRLHRFIKKF